MHWFTCEFQWLFTLVLCNSQFLLPSSPSDSVVCMCVGVLMCVCVCVWFQPTLTNKHMLIMKEITRRSSSTLPLKKGARCITGGHIQSWGCVPHHPTPAYSPPWSLVCVCVCVLFVDPFKTPFKIMLLKHQTTLMELNNFWKCKAKQRFVHMKIELFVVDFKLETQVKSCFIKCPPAADFRGISMAKKKTW